MLKAMGQNKDEGSDELELQLNSSQDDPMHDKKTKVTITKRQTQVGDQIIFESLTTPRAPQLSTVDMSAGNHKQLNHHKRFISPTLVRNDSMEGIHNITFGER